MDNQEIQSIVLDEIAKNLPISLIADVGTVKIFDEFVKVGIRSSDFEINRVKNQYPDYVTFMIRDKTVEFTAFGCMGGQTLHRRIDKNISREKYLALGSEKIPFRKSKFNDEKGLRKIIKRICERYVETLNNILDRGLHLHTENCLYALCYLEEKEKENQLTG